MNIKLPVTEIGLRRCAICKIDLKGRFVFIDDTVESLLELSKEELFGKSLFEFLDSPSTDLVNQIINQRNRYESFYDSTEITLVSDSKKIIPARAIISLNFNAGNPVNFQFILDSQEEVRSHPIAEPAVSDESLTAFVEELLNGQQNHDLKDLVASLSKLTNAEMTIGYIHQNNQLVPFEVINENELYQSELDELPKLSEMHSDLAINRLMYSFLDEDSVRVAVEKYGNAPNEFVIPFDFDIDSTCLIRFIYKANAQRNAVADDIRKVSLAVNLLQRIILDKDNTADTDSSFDIRFVIGFLDSLNVPAFLLDSEGQIAGYNPGMLKYFKEEELSGAYVKLFNRMKEFNDEQMVSKVIEYVTSAYEDGRGDDFQFNLMLAPGLKKQLSVLKFSDKALDLSSCFVFMPSYQMEMSKPAEFDLGQNKGEAELLVSVKALTEKIHNKSIRLKHNFYNELGDEGNELLSEIDNSFDAFSKQVNNYLTILNETDEKHEVECHDLNLLFDDILKKIKHQYDQSNIECAIEKLPKIDGCGFYLKALIFSWLDNLVDQKSRKNIKLRVRAEADNKQIKLIIEDNILKQVKQSSNLEVSEQLLKKFSANAIKCQSFTEALTALEGRINFPHSSGKAHIAEIIIKLS